ncbi:MAG: alpha/beta hydrolase family protein, partial [Acidobacteria bacterium]|nr:alpha/beta hydrolase family protein [Acidobacteriota bacterium]
MVKRIFYRWERRLASVDNNRVVRPFAWGEDWIPDDGMRAHEDASLRVQAYVDRVMADLGAWYAVEPATRYGTAPLPADAGPGERMITFDSAIRTPHPENNTVYLRYFPASPRPRPDGTPAPRRAVVVMAQWNADEGGHVGLCSLLQRVGISAVRITRPYHERRMPPELSRADYIVSSNVGQTLEVCRQAVLDTRRAVAWLDQQGYERIGLLGTSLGSCLSMLTGAHEPLVKAMALNHVSPWFADVVWEGLSTSHVRAGMEGHIDLALLRELWRPISPQCHMDRIGQRPTLLVYALFDLSFPLHLSRDIVREYRSRGIPTHVRVLPCGHYTTGVAPFKYVDAYYLTRFLHK